MAYDLNKFFENTFGNGFSGPYELPFDMNAVLEAQRKNIQALNEAQQLALEGYQAIAQRQSEIISQIVEDNSAIAREVLNEETPERKVAKQTDLVKKVYERSVTNFRELSDMLAKSNQQAADIINKRVSANLAEIKAAWEDGKATKTGKKKAA